MKFYIRDLQGKKRPFYISASNAEEAIGKAFSKLKHHHFHIDEAISNGNTFSQVLSRRLYNLLKKDEYSIELEQIINRTMKEFDFDRKKEI